MVYVVAEGRMPEGVALRTARGLGACLRCLP